MSDSHCYLFVALPCEAKPLINHFKLKKELSITAFTLYRSREITLTVTGIGKSAMAAGVAYTLALFPTSRLAVLLNIGIAGHISQALGSVFVIEKITDQETERCFYPQLVISPPCAMRTLITVAQVQPGYASGSVYEMEASAFYETAIRFSSAELIQCIKIISDNTDNPTTQIKPVQVSLWIGDALPIIDDYRQQLSQLAMQDKPIVTAGYDAMIAQWRFSSYEKLQLKNLLNKRAVLMPDKTLVLAELATESGKGVLNYLREEIAAQAFGGF